MKINKEYQNQIEQIKVDGENYANLASKDIGAEQGKELDILHKTIGKLYIDHAKDGLLVLTTAEKSAIMAKFKADLKGMGSKLATSEVDKVTSVLESVFKDTYYKNIYTLESGMSINLKFPILKKETVDAAINAKYNGEMFSDRIWTNKASMIDKLQSSITSAMRGDTSIDKIGKDIRQTFETTAYESQRLVQCETARVQSNASEEMGKTTGIDQVMWSSTLELHTCSECSSLDGQVWGINEDHPIPPDPHPECRCCLINVPYDGWEPSQRKDSETKDVIAYTNYNDWAKDKGVANDD